jgi:hypothetical protein
MNRPGSNGRYDICFDCAKLYGTQIKTSMGVWPGTCDICGAEHTDLTNAYHDWLLTDRDVEAILATRDRLDSII